MKEFAWATSPVTGEERYIPKRYAAVWWGRTVLILWWGMSSFEARYYLAEGRIPS